MKLIVLNLPRDLSEDSLIELFRAYGEIDACNLVFDDKTGTSKDFGFVDMASGDAAEAAVKALHASKLDDHRVRVKPAG